jgi:Bacterial SH3 domain
MARRYFGLAALFSLTTLLSLAVVSSTFLGSCSSRLGWGVVLWTAPEGPLKAGSVVPVYIKSNIQKVYVVGVPGSKERGKKIELPVWQVELFGSRGKANARVRAMGENVGLYMVAARDGMPLRDKPANTAKRVYRLREGQSVKILEKVEGEPMSTGGQILPGAWYSVLAADGATGYAFSYAFHVYDEAKEGAPVLASDKKALSGRVDLIFSRSWRPEYFQEMLDDGRVDLDYFSLRYGLFIDAIHRQVRLELPAASRVFNYSDVSEAKGLYVFEGTPLRIKIESDARLVCTWSGGILATAQDAAVVDGAEAPDAADAAAAAAAQADDSSAGSEEGAGGAEAENYASVGASGSADFVVLSSEPQEAIRSETLRRQKLLAVFIDGAGGEWGSPSGAEGLGRLSLEKNGRFTWKNRGDAVAAFLPEGAGSSGEAALRLFLDPSLGSAWEGVLSFRFDPNSTDSRGSPLVKKWIDFLYRRSPAGLVLARAAPPVGLSVQAADGRSEPLVLEAAAK